jgi:hypothetical protein
VVTVGHKEREAWGGRGSHGGSPRRRRGGGGSEPPARVREGGRERGYGLVGQLGLLGRSGPKGRMVVGLFGVKVEGRIISE